MKKLKTLKDIKNLKGKKVLLRVDFNVPISEKHKVKDDTRIMEALPTIKFLHKKGAKTILISHLGRPDRKIKEDLRLTPVKNHLSKLLKLKIKKSNEVLGQETTKLVNSLKNGEILMLENIRFRAEEEECEKKFTKELASL